MQEVPNDSILLNGNVKSAHEADKDKIISLATGAWYSSEVITSFQVEGVPLSKCVTDESIEKIIDIAISLEVDARINEQSICTITLQSILCEWIRGIHTSNLVQVLKIDYLSNLFCNEHFVFARPITYIPISVNSHIAFELQSIVEHRRR